MNIYLQNTENNDRFIFQYIPLEMDLGGVQVKYASAEIPQRSFNPMYWQGTEALPRRLQCIIEGSNVKSQFDKLKAWCLPAKGKAAPAIVVLLIGGSTVRGVLLSVKAIAPLPRYTRSGLPGRATVSIEYQSLS